MVLLEFSVSPLAPAKVLARRSHAVCKSSSNRALDYQLHAMGTLVEGELDQVLEVLRRCVEAVAADHNRVTCSAKLDLRRGHSGRLNSKVASVERSARPPIENHSRNGNRMSQSQLACRLGPSAQWTVRAHGAAQRRRNRHAH